MRTFRDFCVASSMWPKGTQAMQNLPSHTVRSPVKTCSHGRGGSVASASSEMGLPRVTQTRTPPSGKAHFAAAYRSEKLTLFGCAATQCYEMCNSNTEAPKRRVS